MATRREYLASIMPKEDRSIDLAVFVAAPPPRGMFISKRQNDLHRLLRAPVSCELLVSRQ
jgi:hypothetical protein